MAYDSGIIYIDFNNDPASQSLYLGHYGEANAHILNIKPSREILNNSDIEYYRLVFKNENEDPVHSASIMVSSLSADDTFDFVLAGTLTESPLNIQLEGYSHSGDVVAKTDVIEFLFRRSIIGDPSQLDPDFESMADEFNERIEALEARPEPVEIWATGTTAQYTAAELAEKAPGGVTYKGHPVIGWDYTGGVFSFTFITTGAASDIVKYQPATVNAEKEITEGTAKYIAKTINGATIGADGSITITAGDIQAATGWVPVNGSDLTTKEYVDPITATTATITPAQANTAVTAGKRLTITHTDGVTGNTYTFSQFALQTGGVISTYTGTESNRPKLFTLSGDGTGWTFTATALAVPGDIPPDGDNTYY